MQITDDDGQYEFIASDGCYVVVITSPTNYIIGDAPGVRGTGTRYGESTTCATRVSPPEQAWNLVATNTVECTTVRFPQPRLTGIAESTNASDPVSISVEPGTYSLEIASIDRAHPNSVSQPMEQWFLEGLNSTGEVLFSTRPSDDLPDDEISSSTHVGDYDLSNVTALRAVHAHISEVPNSISPVGVLIRDETCVVSNQVEGNRRGSAGDPTSDGNGTSTTVSIGPDSEVLSVDGGEISKLESAATTSEILDLFSNPAFDIDGAWISSSSFRNGPGCVGSPTSCPSDQERYNQILSDWYFVPVKPEHENDSLYNYTFVIMTTTAETFGLGSEYKWASQGIEVQGPPSVRLIDKQPNQDEAAGNCDSGNLELGLTISFVSINFSTGSCPKRVLEGGSLPQGPFALSHENDNWWGGEAGTQTLYQALVIRYPEGQGFTMVVSHGIDYSCNAPGIDFIFGGCVG